jgi:hypothetical protein
MTLKTREERSMNGHLFFAFWREVNDILFQRGHDGVMFARASTLWDATKCADKAADLVLATAMVDI